ncbi:hypothetical protein EDB80DRAFT_758082 [Ilyonectria destructans]|nr:hypothetical protein EDB80DRAFT_758082 [Ilyonectria destructans]
MSGFEVVGVVLGTIPLIISTFEHSKRVIQEVKVMRRWAKVMHSLARSLSTEQRILKNTCETLLGGIVPVDAIKPLLAQPFGPLWQDDKIRLEVERRLDHTAGDFEHLVRDMKEVLKELGVKLHIGPDMKVKVDESAIGKRNAVKFAVTIALSFSQHEDAVNRIADANRKLETPLVGNLRNETLRAQASKGHLFSLMQAVTWSIHKALRLSLSCSCASSHGVNLGLTTPRLISRGQDVESIVRKLDFHLAFVNQPQDLKGKGNAHNTWTWDEDERESIRSEDGSKEPPPLPDLCDTFSKRQSRTPRGIHSYITDGSAKFPRTFGVYCLESSDDSDTFLAVSLRDLLDQKVKPASLSRRHGIAAIAAASILNLHGTPWIPVKLTSKDLYFIQRHGKVEYDKVFVAKKSADEVSVEHDTSWDSDNYDGNPSLHAPGVLLMEVMLWKSIHDFWDDVNPKYSHTPAQVLLNIRSDHGFKRTSSFLDRIGFCAGPTYRDAVEHCIKCDMQCDLESLDEQEFRDAVYYYVVAPLQDAAHITTAPMTAGWGRFKRTA